MIVDSNDLPSKLDARILPQLVCVLLLCVANALAVGPSSDQPRCPDGLTTSSALWGQDTVPVPVLVPVPNIPYLPILPLGHNVTCQGQALQPVGPVPQFFVATNSQVLMQNSTLFRNDRSAAFLPLAEKPVREKPTPLLLPFFLTQIPNNSNLGTSRVPPRPESQASSTPGQDPNASAKLSTQDAPGLDDLVYKNPSLFPRQPAPVSPVSQQSDRQSVGKIRKGKIQKGKIRKRQSQKKKKRKLAVAEYYLSKRAYTVPTQDGKLIKVHFGPLPLDTFNVPTTRDAGPSSQCVR